MSNSPDMVVAMVQHLDIEGARDAFDKIDFRYTANQIELIHKVESFFDSVSSIQEKTIRQIPALLKKGVT
jgi:uncharacterized Fe-S cluster-containing protein